VNRQISRVALVSLALLAALIVATTYWQTWAAAGLAARQDNEIGRVAQFEIKRGLIYAADGRTILASNVATKSGGQTLYTRVYPNHALASQTVGYSTQSRARAGLEEAENSYLTASNADLGTIFSTLGDRLRGTTVTGNNLVLTLRSGAQRIADRLLAGTCGAAVALNPSTGAVDVMASSPGFDPNLIEARGGYAKISATPSPCPPESAAPLFNRATEGLFPPGSIFKTITAAAALDNHVYTPASTFYDPGYCTEYGKQITNALDQSKPEAYGLVDLVEAYQYSINAVFCNIGQKLGAKTILEQARRFGFYSVPPLETPSGERAASGLYHHGRLFDPSSASQYDQVDPGRLAFGQETMLVTPLQMALVAAAVADNGVEMTPTLVKRVVSPGGSVLASLKPHLFRRATTTQTAAELRNMMIAVVQGGTGTEAQIPGVVVAGKTGTAETITGSNIYDAWFIFFAPAEHPVVAGAVVIEHQLNGFGGAIAAPIAKQIMEAILPKPSNTTPKSNGH
jgi:peptidoglycan glycosyltransferase